MIDIFHHLLILSVTLCIVIVLSEFHIEINVRKLTPEERKQKLEELKNKK